MLIDNKVTNIHINPLTPNRLDIEVIYEPGELVLIKLTDEGQRVNLHFSPGGFNKFLDHIRCKKCRKPRDFHHEYSANKRGCIPK